ncbi:hypothetical protein ACTHGU_09165 [Chitinophagaceae bacterium MMS25-I14]
MKTSIWVVLFLLAQQFAYAGDSLQVVLNKTIYSQGENLEWAVSVRDEDASYKAGTLQVWIENTDTRQIWQYRFPLINDFAAGTLAISSNIPNGRYAVNFMLQPDFFNISGKVRSHRVKDTVINYLMLAKTKESITGSTPVRPDGSFSIKRLLFVDTAMFVFSQPGRSPDNTWITLKTSLDSSFVPETVVTKFIAVGIAQKDTTRKTKFNDTGYHFDFKSKWNEMILPEVTIKAKSNKLLKEYEAEYVTPLFHSADEITFDGLGSNEIAHSIDIFTFLQSHVPGMMVKTDGETGQKYITWHNAEAEIYVDEYKLQNDFPLTIMPSEVAMIKVLRAGSSLTSSGGGGTIAIYTKIGKYDTGGDGTGNVKSRFYLRGYNALNTDWK